jgi:MFS family permease
MGVAMGLISSMLGLGGGLGLVMSGVIVDHGSWRLLFVVGAVIGLLGIVLVSRFIPSSPQRSAATLDIPGALLSVGPICILVGSPGAQLERDSGRFLGASPGWRSCSWRWVEAAPPAMVDMRMLARRRAVHQLAAVLRLHDVRDLHRPAALPRRCRAGCRPMSHRS